MVAMILLPSKNGKRSKAKLNQVILFVGHYLNPAILKVYREISCSSLGMGDIFPLLHMNETLYLQPMEDFCPFIVTDESLKSLGIPFFRENVVPGSAYIPLLQFYREHPQYDYYWFIEYDVRYSGNWGKFFNYWETNDAHFLTCHIRSYHEEPQWYWWELRHPKEEIRLTERYRSFNPIYRISKEALVYLEKKLREGWVGHYEVLFTTLLYHGGFRVEDFGGRGSFVQPINRNRFYLEGDEDPKGRFYHRTMRWRPSHRIYGLRRNKLYHPVKK